MENQKMNVTLECDMCHHETTLTSDDITFREEFKVGKVGNDIIYLTYYICPKCRKRHFVQIDDEVSLKKLTEVSKLFAKLSRKRKSKKRIKNKEITSFNEARKDLSEYRMLLMNKYTDTVVKDKMSNDHFILRFTKC